VEFDPDLSFDEKKKSTAFPTNRAHMNVTQSAVGDKRGLWTHRSRRRILIGEDD